MPNNFEFVESSGTGNYVFASNDGVVQLNIFIYPSNKYKTAVDAASSIEKKLQGEGTWTNFNYNNTDAVAGGISFGSGEEACIGYALFLNDTMTIATESNDAKPYDFVLLSYCLNSYYDNYADFVESAFDGFCPNILINCPGPLGAMLRSENEKLIETKEIKFGDIIITSQWDKMEAEIAQYLVEREYRVLSSSVSPDDNNLNSAVSRFYQMIYKDTYSSLSKLSLELSKAWETGSYSGEQNRVSKIVDSGVLNKSGIRFGVKANAKEYGKAILSWLQDFVYERDPNGSDVVNPISAAFENRGDCDSRALLMAILLKHENINAIVMISLVHNHSLAAIDATGEGARFPFNDKNWLVAETTAHVDIGRIDKTQSDPNDWIGITLPR